MYNHRDTHLKKTVPNCMSNIHITGYAGLGEQGWSQQFQTATWVQVTAIVHVEFALLAFRTINQLIMTDNPR